MKGSKMTRPEDYLARAEECVRLANLTNDQFIKRELLTLRQTFLRTAEHLRKKESEPTVH
jgi:hypothetical protein